MANHCFSTRKPSTSSVLLLEVFQFQSSAVLSSLDLGELLASAGDDGNVLLWAESQNHAHTFGEDGLEDKETWRTKHMCRSSGAEIYDLAWSPDGVFFITGSMDNIARIYNAQNGKQRSV